MPWNVIVVVIFCLAFRATALGASGDPTPQILLHFDDADGKPVDSSGNEHAIANHGAKPGAAGKFGAAYEFDGETAYVDAGNNGGLTFCFPSQTIELWVHPKAESAAADLPLKEMGILGSQEKPTRSSWRWNLSRNADGTITFSLWDNQQQPPTRKATSKTVAPSGRWTHIAVTLETRNLPQVGSLREVRPVSQRMRLFVNGKEEASDSLKSNTPYGSLFIGSANQGFFAGRIDELAIYDTVLSDDLIARHASGQKPIPDGAPQAKREGFRLSPVGGAATVAIRHSAFPGKSWRLRIPEHAYHDPDSKQSVAPSDIVWERLEDGSLRYRWNAPDEIKRQRRLDYWGWLKPGLDVIEYELTGKNVGDKAWGEAPWGGVLSLICLGAGGNPDFHDYEAQRTFVRKGDRWVTMNEIAAGKFADHRMCGIGVNPGAAEPLAAKVSTDGHWVMGIATDIAGSLSFNFQLQASCMHSNPTWPPLKPGEQVSANGRIYLLKGSLDLLWEWYGRDRKR